VQVVVEQEQQEQLVYLLGLEALVVQEQLQQSRALVWLMLGAAEEQVGEVVQAVPVGLV
jgi:hypothetical protein